jgi:DNA-binding CsgD family transcriptional regulator
VPHQDLPLTGREHEITLLIAAGLTNRQIAARLVIAQRTVDTHVGHILAKLGCSNRSQVAALTATGLRPQLPNRPSGEIRTPST